MKFGICVGAGHFEIAARCGFGYVEPSAAAMRALTPEALREDLTKITETVYPEEALVKRYNRQYEIYRRFYPALKDIV